ncbi:MAG: hypothetical protein ACF8TS_14110, partial [Maioricimonas sp. JB049]
ESARKLVMRLQRCRRAHEWTQTAAQNWWEQNVDAGRQDSGPEEADPFARTVCQRDTECLSAAETHRVHRIPAPGCRADSQ